VKLSLFADLMASHFTKTHILLQCWQRIFSFSFWGLRLLQDRLLWLCPGSRWGLPLESLLCPPTVETDRRENAKLSKLIFSFGIDNVHTPWHTPRYTYMLRKRRAVKNVTKGFFMVAVHNRTDHYIFALLFLSSSIFFYSSLISAAAGWMSTILWHMAWPWCEFRMQVWKVLQAARCKCRTQKSRQKSPSGHRPTTLSGYIFATKACIDNRKKLFY